METIDIAGRAVQAQKIEIRLTGFGALPGHSLYWLRPGDRLFRRYEGPNGIPGIKSTTISLQSALPVPAKDASAGKP
jgi:hypothetical protein